MLAKVVDKTGEEVEARATVRAWGAETQEVAIVVHRVMLAEDKVWEEVEARATVRAWVVETEDVVTVVHRVMLAEVVDKAGEEVEARATAEAWVVETQDVLTAVHRVMLVVAEDKGWEEVEARATAEVWVVKKARVAVKANTLAEDRVVVGIAEAEQAVPVLLVRQAKTVIEGNTIILKVLEDQYNDLCLFGKTVHTTKDVVSRERGSGASNWRPWHIIRAGQAES
jgi:hypothetical protein